MFTFPIPTQESFVIFGCGFPIPIHWQSAEWSGQNPSLRPRHSLTISCLVTVSEFRIHSLNLNLISLYQSGDYTLSEFGTSSDDTTTTQTSSLAFLCPLHTHPGNWIYLSRRGQPVRARKRRRRSLRDRKSDGDGDGDDDGAVAKAPPHHPEDQLTATSSAKDTGNCWHCLLMFMEFPAPSVVVATTQPSTALCPHDRGTWVPACDLSTYIPALVCAKQGLRP